ncbi:MAG: hypothetical protein UU67_C0016G0013 [Candidatus Daviesbacteria bacterium GW2011_GWB1_41_5]|uniref:DUF5659 domain-containing protein n=1 Tax=Candidatus Daviesbacteria bacterium GW2011_GWB1_41_5 TaxID=1618429 RepID=A0A0G0WLY0_9BACT|nr:MAG: hypothetical protein UU67_C0016G0013 [Candidatus Daviesbacteria bacterium GW2011_GWB1_41_5]
MSYEKILETDDIKLAAYLRARHVCLHSIDFLNPSGVLYRFIDHTEINDCLEDYEKDRRAVTPKEISKEIRSLKERIKFELHDYGY